MTCSREKMQSQTEISLEKLKEVIRFQLAVLSSEAEIFHMTIQKFLVSQETTQIIPTVMNTLLADLVH